MGLTVINTEGSWDTRSETPVRVTQDGFAYSDSLPLHTDGLSHCLGVVIHDPKGKRGCLAHLTALAKTDVKALKYANSIWGQCMDRLRIASTEAEYFFCNGGGEWDEFLDEKIGKVDKSQVFDFRGGRKDATVGRIQGLLYYHPTKQLVGASQNWASYADSTIEYLNTGGRFRNSKKAHEHQFKA